MKPAHPQDSDDSRSRTLAIIAKLIAILVATFAFAAFSSKPAHTFQARPDSARATASAVHAPYSQTAKSQR